MRANVAPKGAGTGLRAKGRERLGRSALAIFLALCLPLAAIPPSAFPALAAGEAYDVVAGQGDEVGQGSEAAGEGTVEQSSEAVDEVEPGPDAEPELGDEVEPQPDAEPDPEGEIEAEPAADVA
ncbi:MAG: hypothetical protein LBK98_00495, partial [Peptococcaceae bacterium]|nr:hypothetical protein [Peptococcaceae bacterium]